MIEKTREFRKTRMLRNTRTLRNTVVRKKCNKQKFQKLTDDINLHVNDVVKFSDSLGAKKQEFLELIKPLMGDAKRLVELLPEIVSKLPL